MKRILSETPAWSDFLVSLGVITLILYCFFLLLNTRIKFERSINDRIASTLKRRRNDGDNFRQINGYSWDYVMSFRVYGCREAISGEQRKWSLKMILSRLARGGLTTRLFYNLKRDKIFVKIRAPIERLIEEGDRIDMTMLFDESALEAVCLKGRVGKWAPLSIPYPMKDQQKITKKFNKLKNKSYSTNSVTSNTQNKYDDVEIDVNSLKFTVETSMHPYQYIYGPLESGRDDLNVIYKVYRNGLSADDYAMKYFNVNNDDDDDDIYDFYDDPEGNGSGTTSRSDKNNRDKHTLTNTTSDESGVNMSNNLNQSDTNHELHGRNIIHESDDSYEMSDIYASTTTAEPSSTRAVSMRMEEGRVSVNRQQIELAEMTTLNTIRNMSSASSPTSATSAGSNDNKIDPSNSSRNSTKTGNGCILRGTDRLKLLKSIILCKEPGGCGLDLEELLQDRCIDSFFPLHDYVELLELQRDTLTIFQRPGLFPVDQVKDYLGEKIGLYFAFITYYTQMLIPAGVVGLLFWIVYASDGNNSDGKATPYYAVFVGVWATLFQEFWQRKEKSCVLKWGMDGYEQQESIRPSFQGTLRPSPITGKQTPVFSPYIKTKRIIKSYSVTLILSMSIIAACSAIFITQKLMWHFRTGEIRLGAIIAACWYTVQIEIFNFLFSATAKRLTEFENHRTDTEFEDSLIGKSFVFAFINSYTPLFYIAFVQPFIPELDYCPNSSCMNELQVFLGTIFFARVVLSNLFEVAVPALTVAAKATAATDHINGYDRHDNKTLLELCGLSWICCCICHHIHWCFSSGSNTSGSMTYAKKITLAEKDEAALAAHKSLLRTIDDIDVHDGDNLRRELLAMGDVEKNYILSDYAPMVGLMSDYSELVIQYGYVTMFVAAFPLVSLLALFSTYIEIRVDAWKLSLLSRRPQPAGVEDIGTWFIILEMLSKIAVITNAGIVAYTGTLFEDTNWAWRSWIFVFFTVGTFAAKYIISYVLYVIFVTFFTDMDHEMRIQRERKKLITQKVVLNYKDEAAFDVHAEQSVLPNYCIASFDDDPM